jgi:hypothetical protein
MISNTRLVVVIIIAALFCLASLVGGTLSLIRFNQTRKIGYLLIGLLQVLIFPVLCLFATYALFIPSAMVFY